MATKDIMPLIEEIFKHYADVKDGDFLRETMSLILHKLMEAEVSAKVGAEKYQRNDNRNNHRNGTRSRSYETRLGSIDLNIPKLRQGTYFPSFLEPRRMWEQALVNVIQEAYVHGVSTRKVDELVQAMGLDGIDKSTVSRISKELDEHVTGFVNRPLTSQYPYIWLDATFPKVREGGHVQNMALVVAVGVNENGEREILGFDIGMTESGPFWAEFLRKLVARGLRGVKLVISDAHEGLKSAISEILTGSAWQRCRVHFMRNILCQVPRTQQGMVSAIVRTIFAAPDQAAAKEQLNMVVSQLKNRFPKAMEILEKGCEDVLQYMAFPSVHWAQIHSTNPLERLNREIRRRTDVVSIFPNRPSVIRLVGALLIEQHEEWQVGRKYFSKESMNKVINPAGISCSLMPTALLHK
ncbi:MAG: IS256 family transposase [Nitrospirota bacterium]